MTALHYSDGPLLHQILGLYHAIAAEHGFSDEKRWPRGLSEIDIEERRRLFWHMHRLEVHTSLVIGGHVVRCPELQSSVAYPTIQDIDSTESEGRNDHQAEWLSGWNFVTDLYRGIEHVITQFKYPRASANLDRRRLSTAFILDYDPQEKILDPLAAAHDDLPDRFKRAMPVSSNTCRNRCGYQTANIACTYQASICMDCAKDFRLMNASFLEWLRLVLIIQQLSSCMVIAMEAGHRVILPLYLDQAGEIQTSHPYFMCDGYSDYYRDLDLVHGQSPLGWHTGDRCQFCIWRNSSHWKLSGTDDGIKYIHQYQFHECSCLRSIGLYAICLKTERSDSCPACHGIHGYVPSSLP